MSDLLNNKKIQKLFSDQNISIHFTFSRDMDAPKDPSYIWLCNLYDDQLGGIFYVKEDCYSRGVSGRGNTPENSFYDLCKQLSGKVISVIKEESRDIQFPLILEDIPKEISTKVEKAMQGPCMAIMI